jgi:hypothetical protein
VLRETPSTVQEADEEIQQRFDLGWQTLANTRARMNWLEVLGLIAERGEHKWAPTVAGVTLLESLDLTPPEALITLDEPHAGASLPPIPQHIGQLLEALHDDPALHAKRKDKLGFLPSPQGIRKIEAIRRLADAGLQPLSREDLNYFCHAEFGLSSSSVGSLLTSMKAMGILHEVGPAVFETTTVGREWLYSSEDVDLIRLLHTQVRFVGELLLNARNGIRSTELFAIAEKTYDAQTPKQLLSLLEEARLLEKTKYLHYQTTPLGVAVVEQLPLANPGSLGNTQVKQGQQHRHDDQLESLLQRLEVTARDPRAEGKPPGQAFEEALTDAFRFLGMKAEHIGGSGDTDVLVRFREANGEERSVVVDAKSRTDGVVLAGHINPVNLGQHKNSHSAQLGAVVGSGFGGDVIKDWAHDNGFALITVENLVEALRAHAELGLEEAESGLIFQGQEGLQSLARVIENQRRRLDIAAVVIGVLANADQDEDEDLERDRSPRDIRLETKRSELKPTLDELSDTAELLAHPSIGATVAAQSGQDRTQVVYRLRGTPSSTAKRLRALAAAIERGEDLDLSDI